MVKESKKLVNVICEQPLTKNKKVSRLSHFLCTLVLAIPVDENSAEGYKIRFFFKPKSETHLKITYSEKATKFCEISNVDLIVTT